MDVNIDKLRCHWVNLKNPLYVTYHDTEWGVPKHDDQKLFECLALESFQVGLSWECVLNKRAALRQAFDNFNPDKVAHCDESRIATLLENPQILRNRRKIEAVIHNAGVLKQIQQEFGSFDTYLKTFMQGKIIREVNLTHSPLSDALAADLKKRGMKFVGGIVIYSFLQSIGVVDSHEEHCFLHRAE